MKDNPPFVKSREYSILPFVASVFFVLTFAIKAFTDGPYIRGEISSGVAYTKYFTALVACLCALAYILRYGGRLFVKEFNKLMFIALLFMLVSFALQIHTSKFTATVYIELIKFAMPILLAYCMLNALGERSVYRCMVGILLVSLVGYMADLWTQGGSVMSFLQADFVNFRSETESSSSSEVALMLTLYFAYFRRSKFVLLCSVAFSLLAFKRLAILVALLAFVISVFAPRLMHAQIPKGVIGILKVATLSLTLLWFWLLLPDQEPFFVDLFGRIPFEFTMGRSTSLRYLLSTDFQSYGFGSANETINAVFGVPFEMDLVKIAFELTPVVMVVFVWLFWDLAGNSFWGVFIIGYYMFNMITSDSLASNFSFTLAYIVLGLVNRAEIRAVGADCSPEEERYGVTSESRTPDDRK